MSQFRQLLTYPFVRFLLVGGFAAIANFGSRFVFNRWVNYESAVTLAWGIGLTTAFVLSRHFVFSGARDGHVWRQFAGFTVVNLLALPQTLIVSLIMLHAVLPAIGVTHHLEALAHACGIVAPIFTSYLGHKHLSFRRSVI